MIRNVKVEDAKEIVDIYNHYILNTNVTFEVEALASGEMAKRIEKKIKDNPWIVYEEDNKILGYAYVGEFRERIAYKFTKEVTIYLDKSVVRRGIGTKLMEALIERCKTEYDIHTLISVVTVPNASSISIHKKFGFETVGKFEGFMKINGEYIDCDMMRLCLG